jgi:trans-aconitate methyltransferase
MPTGRRADLEEGCARRRFSYGLNGLAELPRRIDTLRWEAWLRVSTRGVVPVDYPDSVHYATMRYSTIRPILKHLELGPGDVFVDVGSGKGRVLCCAARYPVDRVVGVDISPAFCEEARENTDRMRGRRARVEVHAAPARDLDYSDASVLFLFDPFGAATLAPLLEKIAAERTRDIRIAYANPTHREVFDAQPWLESTAHWDADVTGGEQSVSFYRSR